MDDFKPINYKLKIISPLNRGRKDNPIPVLLEMVENGEFEGEIRIDENLLKSVKNKYFNLTIYTIELYPRYKADEKFNVMKINVPNDIKKDRQRQQEKDSRIL